LAAGLAVGPIHLDHLDPTAVQIARQAGPVGACALHPDPVHQAEGTHPAQQLAVSGLAGRERLHPEQAADAVQRRGHVHIEMSVNSARDQTVSFYDGHRHPFFR
jgi:hypothetical protein